MGAHTRAELPDVALVRLGINSEHALDLISEIVREAACPVIALLDVADPAYVTEAAKRGVFAYVIVDDDPQELQSALDITFRRFAEFHNLEGAFGRRATIEQAKGILMERHGIGPEQAFQQLRSHSQATGPKGRRRRAGGGREPPAALGRARDELGGLVADQLERAGESPARTPERMTARLHLCWNCPSHRLSTTTV